MVSFSALLLPIFLSAVFVYIASTVMHMVLKYHQSDYLRLPNEDKLISALRPDDLKPGTYMFPCIKPQEWKKPENKEIYDLGPVGYVTVFPKGLPNMAKFLSQWFAFCLIASFFVALLTAHTVKAGAGFHHVFHIAAITGFLAYGLNHLTDVIWKGQTWSAALKDIFDGLIYAAITAATFAWLWPR